MQPLGETQLDPQRRVGTDLVGTGVDGVTVETWRVGPLIGVGSTAAVYSATTRDGVEVAVKVLHGELAQVKSVRARFAQEATVSRRLDHQGLVKVFGDGETRDGTPFFVMELLLGETLEARWERKGQRLPVMEVLWAADKVLDVLVRAHARGVIHRDIKPENIFLTGEPGIRLLDFGIARVDPDSSSEEPMTQVGSVLGTLAFMAPEQARGETLVVGVQTDLWALGATMFTLLSGQLVHHGDDFEEIFRRATERTAPSLASVAPDVPRAVVELVDFALLFDTTRRWGDALAMQRAVREVAQIVAEKRSVSALHISAAHASMDDEPVSEPEWELPAKLASVEPPPMSTARLHETLPAIRLDPPEPAVIEIAPARRASQAVTVKPAAAPLTGKSAATPARSGARNAASPGGKPGLVVMLFLLAIGVASAIGYGLARLR